ncbi:hypothetical protein GCM10010103_48920 [Streptomyces paradoxus]
MKGLAHIQTAIPSPTRAPGRCPTPSSRNSQHVRRPCGLDPILLDRTLPMTEAAEAHRILDAHHIGKIVLVNPDTA